VEANLSRFFLSFVYTCIAIGVQLSWGEGWDPINWFNPARFVCLSQTRTSGVLTSYVVVFFVLRELRWEVVIRFADISGITYHHCWNIIVIILNLNVYHINNGWQNIVCGHCCLTSGGQLFNYMYIMACSNSLNQQSDMSLHTLSLIRSNQSLLLLLNVTCLAEKPA
jgi:hypothetical protein